ncbi:MAG: ABC transporter ATP-binding protein [Nostocoides sp.]
MDTLGVVAMLPLMQYLTGYDPDSGAVGFIRRLLGYPSERVLILSLAGLILVAFLAKDICAIFFRRWQLQFMAEEEAGLATRLLEGYLLGPYSWHLTKSATDKLWTVDYAVTNGFTGGFGSSMSAVTEMLTILFIFVSLFAISPPVTVVTVFYLGVTSFFIFSFIRRRTEVAGRRSLEASRQTTSAAMQSFGAVKEIKVRDAQGYFVDSFRVARIAGARARARSVLLSELPKYLLEIVFVVGIGALASFLVILPNSQQGLVLLGVFMAAGTRILPSVVRLLGAINGVRFSRSPLQLLVGEVRMQNAARESRVSNSVTDAIPRGSIVCRKVEFAYSDEPGVQVLRGVDLTIPQGRTVAIVGSSGAGKSTMVDILLGLHEPTDGTVVAGGISIFDNLSGWRSQIAVVPQDVYLLDSTLAQNIAFTDPIDETRMADVIERAQLADLVEALPQGRETLVGERGARLSGGQCQRIGMARALYRRPSYLFLDEATSALDNETERRLTETIDSLTGSMTIVIVAHRLSTVRRCDQLVFMSAGRVAAVGTFDDVAAANAEFANLVALGTLTAEPTPTAN